MRAPTKRMEELLNLKAPVRLNKQQSSASISQGLALDVTVTQKNLQMKQSDIDNSHTLLSKSLKKGEVHGWRGEK